MNCQNKNIIADHKKGDTWSGISITVEESEIVNNVEVFTPLDLTGYMAISRFKNNPSGSTIFEFKSSDGTLAIPNPLNGEIIFQPRIMNVLASKYVFDVQITAPNGDIETICDGIWNIVQDIS
jgi:hypothetical protein